MTQKKATEQQLSDLHAELAGMLKEAIQPEPIVVDGEVIGKRFNAANLNAARQFLKDNNITSTLDSPAVKDLVDSLPSFQDEPGMVQQYAHSRH